MKQTMIVMECDRCKTKEILEGTAEKLPAWGTFSAHINDKSWSIGRVGGTMQGHTAHLCPDCMKSLIGWWPARQ